MTDVATNATPDIFTNLNVGIGTDNPGAILEVFDATSNTIVNVKSGDAGAVLNLIDNSARSSIEQNGTTLKISSDTGAEDASSDIRLQVDGSTKMLINSSGVVQIGDAGLGSDNGDRKLDIIGSGNGQAGLLIANNATSASGTCDISFAPSNKVTGAQIICEAQEDFSSSANRTADLTFQTRKDGTLSEKLRIQSGGGISFNGDTADANALDDYEEGTFTATCANSVTLQSSANLCQYVKIGCSVTVMGQIRVDNSNGSAALIINNLPFTVFSSGEGSAFSVGAVRLYTADMASDHKYVICLTDAGTTNLQFQGVRDNAISQGLGATANGYYMFSVTYRTST